MPPELIYTPIGRVHSPFKSLESMPIQPSGALGVEGSIILDTAFAEGLKDLDGFSHIHVLYHFHHSAGTRLTVTPFLDRHPHGIFATRAPTRPNPIGLSVVELLGIEENVLRIVNVDMLDGTPVLDIKPYVPAFDHFSATRLGWLEETVGKVEQTRSDGRFKK